MYGLSFFGVFRRFAKVLFVLYLDILLGGSGNLHIVYIVFFLFFFYIIWDIGLPVLLSPWRGWGGEPRLKTDAFFDFGYWILPT
jgi:hypothetical protein